jgi:hypothetical protein
VLDSSGVEHKLAAATSASRTLVLTPAQLEALPDGGALDATTFVAHLTRV